MDYSDWEDYYSYITRKYNVDAKLYDSSNALYLHITPLPDQTIFLSDLIFSKGFRTYISVRGENKFIKKIVIDVVDNITVEASALVGKVYYKMLEVKYRHNFYFEKSYFKTNTFSLETHVSSFKSKIIHAKSKAYLNSISL